MSFPNTDPCFVKRWPACDGLALKHYIQPAARLRRARLGVCGVFCLRFNPSVNRNIGNGFASVHRGEIRYAAAIKANLSRAACANHDGKYKQFAANAHHVESETQPAHYLGVIYLGVKSCQNLTERGGEQAGRWQQNDFKNRRVHQKRQASLPTSNAHSKRTHRTPSP